MLESDALTVAGVPEVGEASLLRRLAAEFVGTLLFVAVGAGAVVVLTLRPLQAFQTIEEAIPEGEGALDPFNTALFSGLLGNGLGDTLGIALAFGLILAVLVYALGGVSGAHFNPAVTLALAVGRRLRWADVPAYWVAQCLGAIVGALVIGGIYGDAAVTSGGVDIFLGATQVAENVDTWNAVLAEATIAFILMTAIMAVAIDPRAPKGWSGLVIGISLAAGILLTAAATGGSANPARSLGPLVASWFPFLHDAQGLPWGDLWIYAVGPVIGAAAAALLYESITGLEQIAPAPRPGAATPTTGSLLGGVDEPVAGDVHGGPGGGDDTPNAPGSDTWKDPS